MIDIKKHEVELTWNNKLERWFEENCFYIGYPWRTSEVLKYGTKISFQKDLRLEKFSCMAQGKFYSAGAFSYCRSRLIPFDFKVGRYCSIAPGVELSEQDHPLDRVSTHSFTFKPHAKKLAENHGKNIHIQSFNTLKPAPVIGNDVWIGKDALIKRGIKIGHGAVVAQRAVVTKDVPPYAIVAGIPARIVKYRFDEKTIERLMELNWWNYSFFDFADIDTNDLEQFIGVLGERVSRGEMQQLKGKVNLLDELLKSF